jgi:hypothetical protein
MGAFRSLNLLQGVEGQSVLGIDLESILSASPAQEAEFGALLRLRHIARRMAGNQITMAAINSSQKAIKIVFENTTELNAEPIKEIAKSLSAMTISSTTLESLNAITGNAVGFKHYSESEHYETVVLNTLATLIGDDPSNYASLSVFILNPTPFGLIVQSTKAMTALVSSPSAMAIVTANSAPMQDVASNIPAMTIMTNSEISMHLISQSQTALDEVTDAARTVVVSNPIALGIISSYNSAWTFILSSSVTLDDNIYPLLINLNGLDPSIYPDVETIFSDNSASEIVALNKPSMMAIISESNKTKYPGTDGAFDKIIESDNLETILNSSIAISEITSNESIMNILISNTTSFPILLTSSSAKATIFSSTTLMATMMTTGSDSLAVVQGLSQSATVVNDASIGTFKTVGVSGNIIILTGVMGSIVATTLANTFQGDTQSAAIFNIPGTSLSSGPIDINLPFTNAVWDINSIAATAAGNVTITYADFN